MSTPAGRILSIALMAASLAVPLAARAVPELQLYVEGATYDTTSETWIYDDSGGTNNPIRLWVIGNVDGPGGAGPISDAKLAIAYNINDVPGNQILGDFQVTGSTTGGYGGFTDPSTASDGVLNTALGTNGTVTDGSTPKLGDGSSLPSHGIYGTDIYWQEFLLGDMTRTDSPIADFITAFPTAPTVTSGQINAYEINFSASDQASGIRTALHFDAYNHVQAGNHAKYKFAPFSHDAQTSDAPFTPAGKVPEPPTLLLLAAGLAAAAALRRRHRTERRDPDSR